MSVEIDLIRNRLSETLNPYRFEHSLSVSFISMALAMRYDCDLKKAELAGLCHDAAKRFTDETILKKCDKRGIEISEEEKKALPVLHAIYGAWMAEHKFQIHDPEILSAIRWHTTGKANMSILEKILFVSDYIEPRRSSAPGLEQYRKLAFQDLDLTVYRIAESSLTYLKDKREYIAPRTVEAYEYYKKLSERVEE